MKADDDNNLILKKIYWWRWSYKEVDYINYFNNLKDKGQASIELRKYVKSKGFNSDDGLFKLNSIDILAEEES